MARYRVLYTDMSKRCHIRSWKIVSGNLLGFISKTVSNISCGISKFIGNREKSNNPTNTVSNKNVMRVFILADSLQYYYWTLCTVYVHKTKTTTTQALVVLTYTCLCVCVLFVYIRRSAHYSFSPTDKRSAHIKRLYVHRQSRRRDLMLLMDFLSPFHTLHWPIKCFLTLGQCVF